MLEDSDSLRMVSVPRSVPLVGVQTPVMPNVGIPKPNEVTVVDRLEAEVVSVPSIAGITSGSPASMSVEPVPLRVTAVPPRSSFSWSVTALSPSDTGTTPGMSEIVALSETLVELSLGRLALTVIVASYV